MEKIKIALFHYHFLPGGVTTVAALAVNALLEYGLENPIRNDSFLIEEICFISGREENLDNLISSKIKNPDGNGVRIRYEVCHAVDYLSAGSHSGTQHENTGKAYEILKLFKKFSSYIWWIHNYHLGKNPLFTSILTQYLSENSSQKAILHIHDFPECGRLSNFNYLTKYTKFLYPAGNNIRYAAINSRDKGYLIRAGIPESCVSLLYDPVPENPVRDNPVKDGPFKDKPFKDISAEEAEIRDKAKKILSGAYGKFFPGFRPDKPFALYPVRTIRRKNILEAALLASITGDGFNLIVTLPGVSDQEKNYSDIVKSCFENGSAPGIWGCGSPIYGEAASFEDVIAASDFILSSSVLEGFGYLFIDALRWGKPLAARYLDIIEGFKDIFDNTASCFYRSVNVPLSISEREEILTRWLSLIKAYSNIIDSSLAESIESNISSLFSLEYADFSFLPVSKQAEILKRTKNDFSFRDDIRQLNSKTVSEILNTIVKRQTFNTLKASEYFSYKSFAGNFSQVISSLNMDKKESELSNQQIDISGKLLSFFMTPEYLRLLLAEK